MAVALTCRRIVSNIWKYEPEVAGFLWMRVQLKNESAQNVAQKAEVQLQPSNTRNSQIQIIRSYRQKFGEA